MSTGRRRLGRGGEEGGRADPGSVRQGWSQRATQFSKAQRSGGEGATEVPLRSCSWDVARVPGGGGPARVTERPRAAVEKFPSAPSAPERRLPAVFLGGLSSNLLWAKSGAESELPQLLSDLSGPTRSSPASALWWRHRCVLRPLARVLVLTAPSALCCGSVCGTGKSRFQK